MSPGHAGRSIRIGKSTDCDLVLDDPTVSRVHAEFSVTHRGQLVITDCRSLNGTFVIRGGMERRVEQAATVDLADQVRLGAVKLPVADLVDHADSGRQPAPIQVKDVRVPAPPPNSDRERCECGTVKIVGEPCPNPRCHR